MTTAHEPVVEDEEDVTTRGSRPNPWADLSIQAKVVASLAAITVAYIVLYVLPGTGDWVQDKVPYGVLFIGGVQGTTTALMAMGLILIYRTNRFINFAYAAMGALPGAWVIGLHLEHGVPFFLALPLGVAIGVGVGFITELIIRRFRHSSRLIVTVASIGLAQILGVISLFANQRIGFLSIAGGFEIPIDFQLQLDVVPMRGDELLILLVVPAVIAGLAWFLLRTDAGIALRASAENEDRALLLGIPVYKLGRIVWMIAGGLAALTFILQAPRSGVAPGVVSAGPAVLLPALAAAVVARLESLPLALGAGVGLGMIDQLVRWNFSDKPTLTTMIFLAVILIALLAQRGSLSRAMNSESATFDSSGVVKPIPRELRFLPEVRIAKWVLGTAVVAAFVLIPAGWSPSNQLLAATAVTWAMIGVSLVLLTGWGGHISLGQFAIAGLAGMVAGNLIQRNDIDFFLILLFAGAVGAVVALALGLPALRIKGLFLAVTTLAFAVALDAYVLNTNNFPSVMPSNITRPYVWERWDLADGYSMYLVCLAFLALSYAVVRRVRGTRSGRVIIATRDNERAADSASVPTTRIKLTAFLVAGAIAGIAGALHITILHGIGMGQYSPDMSLEVFATAVIGGLGSLAGAISGVLAFQFLGSMGKFEIFGLFKVDIGVIRPLISGSGLLIVLYAFPGGFAQIASNFRDRLLRVVANRRGIIVPSLVADKRRDADHPEDETGLLAGALDDDDAPGQPDDLVGASR